MALNHHPKIVTNGLIFYIDPSNKNSYSGTGLTLENLMGGTGATLVNGPVFSPNNLGYIDTDGSNDYLNLTLPSLTSYTIDFWLNINSYDNSERQLLGTNGDIVGISLYTGKFNVWNGSTNIGNASFTTTVWYNAVFTRNGTGTTIHLNGAVDKGFLTGNTISSGRATIGSIIIAGNPARNTNAYFGSVKIYNRALSINEIKQNYNALKGRYET